MNNEISTAMETDRQVVEAIMQTYPDLSNFGFGVFEPRRKSPAERMAELAANRALMLEFHSIEQFGNARSWLKQFAKVRSFNLRGSSSGLKHVAERHIGYATNGMFITAAIGAGFEIKRCHPDSPNAYLNISSLAWKNP